MESPFLVIAAGGTGGHMFPAQALAQEMLRRGWRVALSTDERGLRYAGGFPEQVERREVRSATFARGGAAAKLQVPFQILRGVSEAQSWFRESKPSVVAGFGGYPSLPALTAAWRLGLPRLIHEQNGVLGRVNRIFATRVDGLAAGVYPMSNAPEGAPVKHIGNPIRDTARAFVGQQYTPPSKGEEVRVLIFGGSQGASVFAKLVPAALAQLPEDIRASLRITQQVRPAELDDVRGAYAAFDMQADLAPFFDDMPKRIAQAHLAITRAGASTIAELTAIGRPAILFPYPAATADHQTANARALAEKSAAILSPDAATTPESLSTQITDLLRAPDRLSDMARQAAQMGKPDAAERLADFVQHLAERRV